MPGRPQHGIEAEIEMGQDIAIKDDLHVLVRILQGILAGAEGHEDRIEPDETHGHDDSREDDIHHDHVAQHAVGAVVVLLAQVDSQQRGRTYAHQTTEGGTDIHEGFCHRESTQRQGSAAVADIDGIDDIVQRSGRHRDDGGHGVLPEKSTHRGCSKFGGSTHNWAFSYQPSAISLLAISSNIAAAGWPVCMAIGVPRSPPSRMDCTRGI